MDFVSIADVIKSELLTGCRTLGNNQDCYRAGCNYPRPVSPTSFAIFRRLGWAFFHLTNSIYSVSTRLRKSYVQSPTLT